MTRKTKVPARQPAKRMKTTRSDPQKDAALPAADTDATVPSIGDPGGQAPADPNRVIPMRPEVWRARLSNSGLVARLLSHAMGRDDQKPMTPTQVRAATALLDKVLPSLSAVALDAQVDVTVSESFPRAKSYDEWLAHRQTELALATQRNALPPQHPGSDGGDDGEDDGCGGVACGDHRPDEREGGV